MKNFKTAKYINIAFAVAFLSAIWIGVYLKIIDEKEVIITNMKTETENVARLFEENVARSISEVDQKLRYIIKNYERNAEIAELDLLFKEDYSLDKTKLEIGVIDPSGFMIAKNTHAGSMEPIYLGDREYFFKHINSDRNLLFISKPAILRSTKYRSLQLSRSFLKSDGTFGGVIVASFDPAYLAKLFSGLNLGPNSGLALVGLDGIVRAGAGVYAEKLGSNLKGSELFQTLESSAIGIKLETADNNGTDRASAFRRLPELSQIVVVTAEDTEQIVTWARNKQLYLATSALASVLIILGVARIIYMQLQLQKGQLALQIANEALEFRVKRRTLELEIERSQLASTNDELAAAKDKAELLAKTKSDFLSNMSHELRTPMHAILCFSDMGVTSLNDNDLQSAKKFVGNIGIAGKRLLGLLNDLLDLSQMQSGKMNYIFEDVDFCEIIECVTTELIPLLRGKNITLNKLTADMPIVARVDKNRMVQVIINMISNAIKFSGLNSNIIVEVYNYKTDKGIDAIKCRVIDEGPGIPVAELKSIFEKFVQSSNTKTGAGGTGLGLAICREIVEAHGGEIWAENVEPRGAAFSFTIPIKQ